MPFILAIDYDGTLVKDVFPEKGSFRRDILEKAKEFKKHDAEVVLWTCREGKLLEEAVERCKEEGLEFDSVNENSPSQLKYMEEQKKKGDVLALHKIFADFYADDRSMNLSIFLNIDVKSTCERYENR